MKKIAVLTSGGDAPGMNAAIRAVVRTALYYNLEAIGVRRGYAGLIDGDFQLLGPGDVGDIIQRGGTILQTARSQEFLTREGRAEAVAQVREAGIDGLVAIGGDGTFRGLLELDKLGFPAVGVPGTIDNDIPCTDRSIGFDTVINTVLDAVNKIRDTASSHGRVFIIEVMGRNSGEIALAAGLAGGAESILLPELPLRLDEVIQNVQRGKARGKRHSIIILAEGLAHSADIAREIGVQTGLDTRYSILGYIQRGGTPSAQDRILASRLGSEAVKLLLEGKKGLMVGVKGDEVIASELSFALAQKKALNLEDYRLAGILSI